MLEEYKAFDGGEPFLQPEKPFMLIYTNKEDSLSMAWLETEEDLLETVNEVTGYGCRIVEAIEIKSCRDVKVD